MPSCRTGDPTTTLALGQLIVSFAATKPIALSLVLLFGMGTLSAAPLLADTGAKPKGAGDLGFWEDLAFWETVKDSKDPAEFQAYLAAYPNGRFARLAEMRIKALKDQATPLPETEPVAPAPEGGRPASGGLPGDGVAARGPGRAVQDCSTCPLMVEVPAGTYLMGSDQGRPDEKPRHEVRFARPFLIGAYEITAAEWDACLREGGCRVSPEAAADSQLPASNLSWDDAQGYVAWLSKKTGHAYRLPSEAEWEYAASGGRTTTYWWGDQVGKGNANCIDCGSDWDGRGPAPVGSFKPNPFGLFDVHGNLWEWTMDCSNSSYKGAPADGSAWLRGDCIGRVLRGGSWKLGSEYMRTTRRHHYDRDVRYYLHGFRVARFLEQ
jgi:formylglycine-generating enzyme required for sulfatase activity